MNSVIVTTMPSTGKVTNISESDLSADENHRLYDREVEGGIVAVYSTDEFTSLCCPACGAFGTDRYESGDCSKCAD